MKTKAREEDRRERADVKCKMKRMSRVRRREVKEGTAGKRGEGKCQDECNI